VDKPSPAELALGPTRDSLIQQQGCTAFPQFRLCSGGRGRTGL